MRLTLVVGASIALLGSVAAQAADYHAPPPPPPVVVAPPPIDPITAFLQVIFAPPPPPPAVVLPPPVVRKY